MAEQKTISQLETEREENELRIAQLQHQKQRIENRISYYERGDRRKRAHRLITRGAAIESVVPMIKKLTETEFYEFTEKVFALSEVTDLLSVALREHDQKERC